MRIYQQLNLKNKLSKQAELKQNHRYGEHWDGGQWGGVSGGMGQKVKGLRSINSQLKNN